MCESRNLKGTVLGPWPKIKRPADGPNSSLKLTDKASRKSLCASGDRQVGCPVPTLEKRYHCTGLEGHAAPGTGETPAGTNTIYCKTFHVVAQKFCSEFFHVANIDKHHS